MIVGREARCLPVTTRTSVLSLIHKGGKREELKNERPISLTNTDYKIMSSVFANRMQNILEHVIHTDQAGYVEGRYIGCNVRNIVMFLAIVKRKTYMEHL